MDTTTDQQHNSSDKLITLLREGFELEPDAPLCRFALHLCRSVSAEELSQRSMEDLYGGTVEAWRFFEQHAGRDPKIRAFNPHFEQHGWSSPHTVVMILSRDMPFVIDSVRMELNRREITTHSIANAIMDVERDDAGRLIGMGVAEQTGELTESLILLEINRHTDLNQLSDLERTLQAILLEVEQVTSDFHAMRAATAALRQRLAADPGRMPPPVQQEALAFIDWLLADHFTYLGYRPYHYDPASGQLKVQRGSGLGLLRRQRSRAADAPWLSQSSRETRLQEVVCFAKSPRRSRVHRPAYTDFIALREFDGDGQLVTEHRYLGLYTSAVYFQSSREIPVIRQKVQQVLSRAGLHPGSHDYKALVQILETHPRDDLFQSDEEELYQTALGILHIHERRQVRVFFRRDPFGRYYSVLVFTPRDIFNTDLRKRVQRVLSEELDAWEVEFNTFISESILARTQFILHLSLERKAVTPDFDAIRQRIVQVTRSWEEQFQRLLGEALGEEAGASIGNRLSGCVPVSYREEFSPRAAVADVQTLVALTPQQPLALSFYRPLDQGDNQLNFKVFHRGSPLPLSDIIPIMENLGLRVLDEHPYQFTLAEAPVWLHDFRMQPHERIEVEPDLLRDIFEEAFLSIWQQRAESDPFNRLILSAQLDWREVVMLRAMAAYMKQTGFPFSLPAIAGALQSQAALCRQLVALFHLRCDPARVDRTAAEQLGEQIEQAIDAVASLTQDRILRRYLQQLRALKRTNYFQREGDGGFPQPLAFKFAPAEIGEIPPPVPFAETFVYSPRTEGVHLRNGPVARGGLRWSDRNEDYRTEVLGLVKAQQVKNAVIVPVGAKGGFVCKRPLEGLTPPQRQQEGIACYREFISGLLDLADNLVGDDVVPPQAVVRYDGDDPYLVVAADKGTATFSDIANQLAASYGYWLGDAFASGGSQGYDHKAMGITARGAWVSVQRHFRERGIDIQTTPFTVIGIGDMGGDVFGNGMLLSPCIELLAAFNHRHIFIDPDPDPATSLQERRRLFDAVAGWDSYDPALISSGGGVWDRHAKSITISPAMKRRFALQADRMTPNELIHALLKAPVALLWNGGIGTYVKSGSESHADVGDKANDPVRVNASELRCQVVGEGGNLGMTQRARSEFNLAGGACNSDFVDNAGGVDCSDHEVNIKIMLDRQVEAGELTVKQRNQRLRQMSDAVAALVLDNSYRQTQAISIAAAQCQERMHEYRHLISRMERSGLLDRSLEAIPDDGLLEERQGAGGGLTRNELAVLVAYAKAELKEVLNDPRVSDDPLMNDALMAAFPAVLVQDFTAAIREHRLRAQLIASQLANQMINHMGVTYVPRLRDSADASLVAVAQAYMVARTIYRLDEWWRAIESLDNQLDAAVQLRMMSELQRLVRRAGRWLLRSRGEPLDTQRELQRFTGPMQALADHLGEWLQGRLAQKWRDRFDAFSQAGVPEGLARQVASVDGLYVGLAIIEVAEESGAALQDVVQVYCLIGEQLEVFWFSRQIDALAVATPWQAKARESFRDELDLQVRTIATIIIACAEQDMTASFAQWRRCNHLLVERWLAMLGDLGHQPEPDYAIFAVATRELAELAHRCEIPCARGQASS